MIRLVLVALYLVLYFIISLPVMLFEFILRKFNMRASVTSSQAIVRFNFKMILKLAGTRVTCKGLENIPRDTPVLFVSNHRSLSDIPVAYTTLPINTGFIAKKEMENIPGLSWWMRLLNCQFIDRQNIKEGLKTILKGIELIKDGYSIFIAPEGTRSKTEDMLPFKEGSLKMAEKTGCPIIPVALSNTDAVFEKQFPKVKKAHVIIEYCKPVYIDELDKEQRRHLGAYVQEIIRKQLEQNRLEIKSM